MLTLICVTCGNAADLDATEVVADAQVVTFIDAHHLHVPVRIRLVLRGWTRNYAASGAP
jgi:hypothetical protein